MKNQPYCDPEKGENYFCLLKCAGIMDNSSYFSNQKNREAIVYSLNTLPSLFPSYLRPLAPLIYSNLSEHNLIDKIQPEVKALLRQLSMSLIAVDILNQQWLTKTFSLLNKHAISVVLLKGTAFSRNLYPVHAPRIGVDLDLLVTGDTFETACELIGNIMQAVVQSNERIATHDTLFERVFQPKQGGMPTVEIHRGLTNPHIFSIDEQNLWAGSRKHPAYNSDLIRILSPEDTLLHLAVHAFRDLNFCNHNLLDTHEIWCQWKPDPDSLLERAKRWGAKQVLYYLLENSRIVMNTPIPETLLTSLQPKRLNNAINKKILEIVTQDYQLNNNFCYRITQLISQLSFPDSLSGSLKYQAHYMQTRMKDWFLSVKE